MNAQPQAGAADVVSIRARPPSPKRLSRKVLLIGALGMGALVAVALMLGLSERPERAGAETQANASAAGPPETIRLAPPSYDAALMSGAAEAATEPVADLEPPADRAWTGAPTPGAAEGPAPARADPEDIARASSILFAAPERPRSGADAMRLEASLTPPRSPFEVMAGSVIPAALLTELNSDLPGRVIAQVSAPVFDSVSGAHLLIPQGSRLIGVYESDANYGDQRLVLSWQRLILPNGWSIALENMQGADSSGAAGLRDRTDNHLDRLGVAIGLSAIMSVVANESEEDDETDSLGRSVGDAAAQEAARSGGRIIDRELAVRPTLRVRAGAPVRVLVMRDIRLRPYRP